jgi:uncharacterized protein YceK
MEKISLSLLLLLVLTVSGCTETIMSNERIQSTTAAYFGVNAEAVTIKNRRTESFTTYYMASLAKKGTYNCVLDGSILTMGLTNPPVCSKK